MVLLQEHLSIRLHGLLDESTVDHEERNFHEQHSPNPRDIPASIQKSGSTNQYSFWLRENPEFLRIGYPCTQF